MLALGSLAGAEPRPPVRVELPDCLAAEREAIEQAIVLELGDQMIGEPIVVVVRCAPEGPDAGIVLDVQRPNNPRHYRYALDWRGQAEDTRARLVGLAVVEAVDASGIELTAVGEPPRVIVRYAAAPRHPADRTVALIGERRMFGGTHGADLLGFDVHLTQRLGEHTDAALGIGAGGDTVVTASGAVNVVAASIAPAIAIGSGDRLRGTIDGGVRIGVVRMQGTARPGAGIAGETKVRAWLGPEIGVAVGVRLGESFTIGARGEVGMTVVGASVRDFGMPVSALDGAWLSLGVSAMLSL